MICLKCKYCKEDIAPGSCSKCRRLVWFCVAYGQVVRFVENGVETKLYTSDQCERFELNG